MTTLFYVIFSIGAILAIYFLSIVIGNLIVPFILKPLTLACDITERKLIQSGLFRNFRFDQFLNGVITRMVVFILTAFLISLFKLNISILLVMLIGVVPNIILIMLTYNFQNGFWRELSFFGGDLMGFILGFILWYYCR